MRADAGSQPTLSVAILARDEAHYLRDCIASLHGLNAEIVVLVDSSSRDATATIAADAGAQVHRAHWRGFPGQRNLALSLCHGTWVLFLDADERLTEELRTELQQLSAEPPAAATGGYLIPRYNIFFGRILQGGGWYPDHQLRLMRRLGSQYDEQIAVHEVASVIGRVERLKGHLRHINIETLPEFAQKQSRYAWAEARSRLTSGRRARRRNVAGGPLREFVYRFVTLEAWRDGLLGLFLAVSLAWFEYVTQLMWRALLRQTADRTR